MEYKVRLAATCTCVKSIVVSSDEKDLEQNIERAKLEHASPDGWEPIEIQEETIRLDDDRVSMDASILDQVDDHLNTFEQFMKGSQ